jgi:hypothetical protein
VYWSSTSYPELRELSFWPRQAIWWRAFRSGLSGGRLWVLMVLNVGLAFIGLGGILAALSSFLYFFTAPNAQPPWWSIMGYLLVGLGGIAGVGVVSLTYGARLMRPHLRRVDLRCRHACPHCGYGLHGQIIDAEHDEDLWPVRCPECGGSAAKRCFFEPYDVDEPSKTSA